jgi:hypothetical protein
VYGTGYFARDFSHTRQMFMKLTPDVTTAEEDSTSTIKELNRMYDFFFNCHFLKFRGLGNAPGIFFHLSPTREY